MSGWGCGLLALVSPCPSLETESEEGPGARAGAAGGAKLRKAVQGAPTPVLFGGAGRGKDSRLRGSRRCQCGGAREWRGRRAGAVERS